MPDRLERELDESKSWFEDRRPPAEERIDASIRCGIRQANLMRQRRRERTRRWIWSGTAVCSLFLLLGITVRVSPAFAAVLRDIPGMDVFVKLVERTADQGIRQAVQNEYVQPVGVSDEKDGVRFTVDGILADDSRLVALYSLRSTDGKDRRLGRPNVLDPSGKPLQASIVWGDPVELQLENQEKGVQRGTLDIQLAEGVTMPDEVVLKASFERGDQPPEIRDEGFDPLNPIAKLPETGAERNGVPLEVRIPIVKARFASLKREIPIGQTIETRGQKITVVKAVVDPLRISVEMTYDEANSKQIFDPVDAHLTDGQGTVWRYIGGSEAGTNRDILYFESSFFHAPKELYLEGKQFRALDKDKMSVVINTDSGELLQAPDEKLKLREVQKTDRYSRITLTLRGLSEKDPMGYTVLKHKFKDADGQEHWMGDFGDVVSTWMVSTQEQHSFYYLNNETFPQPLTFQISSYPSYIEAPYRIRIQ